MKIMILIPVYNDWQSVFKLMENINLEVSSLDSEFSVIISVGLALGLALLLAPGGKLRLTVRTLLILPFAMSPALIGISWRFMLQPDFGLF